MTSNDTNPITHRDRHTSTHGPMGGSSSELVSPELEPPLRSGVTAGERGYHAHIYKRALEPEKSHSFSLSLSRRRRRHCRQRCCCCRRRCRCCRCCSSTETRRRLCMRHEVAVRSSRLISCVYLCERAYVCVCARVCRDLLSHDNCCFAPPPLTGGSDFSEVVFARGWENFAGVLGILEPHARSAQSCFTTLPPPPGCCVGFFAALKRDVCFKN